MLDFPIKINNITFMSSDIVPYIRKCKSDEAIEFIIAKTSCTMSEAEEVVSDIKSMMYNNGYPIRAKKSADAFNVCPKCGKKYPVLKVNCDKCGYSTDGYRKKMEKLQSEVHDTKSNKAKVKCPYCSSGNVTKISNIQRSLSTYLLGLGSSKIGRQWHCNDCNSDF